MAVPNLTPNSPVAGSIAWSAFSIQYGGVGYSVAAGSTPNKYVWWVYNGGSPSLQAGNTLPTNLTADDIMLFVNKAGIPVNVQASTVIDGSLVVDGSIIGTAIAAGTVHGDRIQGGTLTIGHTAGLSTAISGAQSGAVTEMKNLWGMPGNTTYIDGRDIYTGTVAAQSIAIADFNNYAYDGMFTYPFGTVWSGSGGSITTSTTEPNYLEIPSVVGTNQDHYAGANFPVLPGDSFFVSYEVLAPATNTAWNNVNLHIACRNDAAITNQWPSIGKPGSELQAAPDTWQKVTGVITIPSGAVEGRVGLAVSTLTGSTGNKFRFRNVMVMKRNSGELIVDGAIKTAQLDANAITSKHTITGPLFQTTATANRGIKIVSSANGNFGSLVAYDGSSVPTLTINGQDGSITMKGALESGSSVTGATVQTTATASRGIKLTSAGLIGYSDTGEAKFTLTPTGGLTLKGAGIDGAITTGGSIEGATITGWCVADSQYRIPRNQDRQQQTHGLPKYRNLGRRCELRYRRHHGVCVNEGHPDGCLSYLGQHDRYWSNRDGCGQWVKGDHGGWLTQDVLQCRGRGFDWWHDCWLVDLEWRQCRSDDCRLPPNFG